MDSNILLQDFTKKEVIGSGSFGTVYKIIHNRTNKIYAAKILNREFNNSKNYLKDLSGEFSIFPKLNHPSILQFIAMSYFSFNDLQRPTLICQYAANRSLENFIQLIKENEFPYFWNKTIILCNIYAIASVMKYLHKNDIIHGDLKPENILLNEYLLVLVGDFGLSKALDKDQKSLSMTTGTKVGGTTIYIAPELWDKPVYTKECDVYSFAHVLYFLFTKEVPYSNLNQRQFFKKVVDEGYRPEFNSDVPEAFQSLISRCWSIDPKNRPTFEKITQELEENGEYLLGVDIEKYHKFIELLKNYQTSFDSNHPEERADIFDEIFEKVDIENEINKVRKIDFAFENFFNERIEELNNLPFQKQQTIKDIIFTENNDVNYYQLHVKSAQINSLYKDETLDSYYLINLLKFIQNITFEIEFPSENYSLIMEKITKIKTKMLKKVRVEIIASKVNCINDEFKNTIINKIEIKQPVQFISKEAFNNCILLESVTIPPTVTIIKDSLFRMCERLVDITLPPDLYSIGDHALRGCHFLRSIMIPDSVREIGKSCFRGDNSLECMTLPDYINEIKPKTFKGCSLMKEVKIPRHTKIIEYSAFEACVNLKRVDIPPSVKEIKEFAFKSCRSLNHVSFDPKNTIINKDAFDDCKSLHTLTITTSESSINIDLTPFKNVRKIEIPKNAIITNPLPGIIIENIDYTFDNALCGVPFQENSFLNYGIVCFGQAQD